MTDGKATVTNSAGKGLRIALAVSVALNLAVAGLAAGAFFKHGGPEGRDGMIRDLGFGPFTEALSPADRDALRRAFIAKVPDIRKSRSAMRQNQQELLAALRAQPFDKDRLVAVMQAQSDRASAQLGTGQALLQDLLLNLSDEARREFAGRLEQRLARGRVSPKGNQAAD